MKTPKFPAAQAVLCAGLPCAKREQIIDVVGFETTRSGGRNPVAELLCADCLLHAQEVFASLDPPPSE